MCKFHEMYNLTPSLKSFSYNKNERFVINNLLQTRTVFKIVGFRLSSLDQINTMSVGIIGGGQTLLKYPLIFLRQCDASDPNYIKFNHDLFISDVIYFNLLIYHEIEIKFKWDADVDIDIDITVDLDVYQIPDVIESPSIAKSIRQYMINNYNKYLQGSNMHVYNAIICNAIMDISKNIVVCPTDNELQVKCICKDVIPPDVDRHYIRDTLLFNNGVFIHANDIDNITHFMLVNHPNNSIMKTIMIDWINGDDFKKVGDLIYISRYGDLYTHDEQNRSNTVHDGYVHIERKDKSKPVELYFLNSNLIRFISGMVGSVYST